MDSNTFNSYLVEDRSYAAYIKREIHRSAMHHRFTETEVGEIDIIVSELTSNLVKHAGSGELLYRFDTVGEHGATFEIISIDQGPGIADPGKMMKDGVSTVRTLGQGLGAMSRLSTAFQLYSMPAWGTVVYACYSTKGEKPKKKGLDLNIRALCVNKINETVCGDGYCVRRTDEDVQIFFGDGLGHGEHAHSAVNKAKESFLASKETEPSQILREMHENVRRSRGLVACVAVMDKANRRWKICGIGNIMTRLYSGISYKNYMSYNGTVGLNIPNTLKESFFEVERNQHLILNSDGIRSRWDLTQYPSIFKYDGPVLAAAIYKDYSRRTDDASILVAKVT